MKGYGQFACLLLLIGCISPAFAAPVTLLRTPGGGIQPQAVADAAGTLHLVYYGGDAAHGDLFYTHKALGADASFSPPIRVNRQPGSALAIGAIRGGQIAVGPSGRVYVVWNGSGQAAGGRSGRAPMLYARLNAAGTAFEPERNLITSSEANNIDGGGSVAADSAGRVYVTWHATPPGKDESAGGVYLARSTDGGRTFAPETRINPRPTGACGCCSMRAFVDRHGVVYVLYRAAAGNTQRDTTLLVSRDHGKSFTQTAVQPWPINACPMSMFSLAEGRAGVLGGWETQGQVYYGSLAPGTATFASRTPAPGAGAERKYPVVVPNSRGETLLAWSDGSGWQRGGTLAWQVYDAQGRPTAEKGRVPNGVPVWSMPTAVARPDGSFLLIY